MGYYFNGILTSMEAWTTYKAKYEHLCAIELYQHIVAIPISDDFYDELNNEQAVKVQNYDYLIESIKQLCSDFSMISRTAYIEVEYFGGVGTQNAIVWDATHIIFEDTSSEHAVNKALQQLGVVRTDDHDEFDTVKLGRHRSTERWLKEEKHLQ
ncbi:hypothetical protein [Paenibacillus hunanensis]|uniref:Uncharacterized protein n=1 Tax=Paenibacillus hunanensis TaxID=539262 RepID=A0ABU1J2G1_9BACL|nr:hypothetical protein [Paenibacillus hunanensis]MDR6245681.1 hypothetical protein [Paenibacillus hunanensis]GGJ28069.1 hypothetical protein GCM10008022_41140 [Paenibacillus hunanensis]